VATRSQVVPSRPAAFVEARRFVRETATGSAAGQVPRHVVDDAMLLTSELVTNAVRHSGQGSEDPIELTVSVETDRLRVMVRDRGTGFDPGDAPARSDNGGWGLTLVRRLSSRWGVDRTGGGTDVWFEIDLPGVSGP
jgi:anti-sigma regulatory factor (Ser/Thr protein kinase)